MAKTDRFFYSLYINIINYIILFLGVYHFLCNFHDFKVEWYFPIILEQIFQKFLSSIKFYWGTIDPHTTISWTTLETFCTLQMVTFIYTTYIYIFVNKTSAAYLLYHDIISHYWSILYNNTLHLVDIITWFKGKKLIIPWFKEEIIIILAHSAAYWF